MMTGRGSRRIRAFSATQILQEPPQRGCPNAAGGYSDHAVLPLHFPLRLGELSSAARVRRTARPRSKPDSNSSSSTSPSPSAAWRSSTTTCTSSPPRLWRCCRLQRRRAWLRQEHSNNPATTSAIIPNDWRNRLVATKKRRSHLRRMQGKPRWHNEQLEVEPPPTRKA
jgi:hypothetical protein